jgi:hypothetical protein
MPVSAEERAALFAEYHRTDDRGLRDELIEMNIGLAEAVARRASAMTICCKWRWSAC